MTKLLSLKKKPTAAQVLALAVASPKTGINLSKKGVAFLDFYDWIRVAAHALNLSPHAESWRALALEYPHKKAVKELPLFMNIIKVRPLLAEQARSFLFSIPASLLPAVNVLQTLPAEIDDQEQVKQGLVQKKLLGDKGFIKAHWEAVIKKEDEDLISFPVANGNRISTTALSQPERWSTIYGMATVISLVDENHNEAGNGGCHVFLLIDGEPFVRKESAAKLSKLFTN